MAKRLRDTDPRKRDMRLRFKRLVSAVMLNRQWLDETDEQAQGISMNVKKNVAFLVRQKRKSGILTVAEKALLRSPSYYRTVEERKKLCLIVAGLSCFSRIPPKLRARLVPVLRFSTVSADRVLIKEHDYPLFIYFVVSGEIEMKKTVYDKCTKKTSMISEAIVGPGDWIGEVELLENCPRLNTYVTMTTCELLTITDDDFKTILRPYMKKQWLDKKNALKSLSYFDFWTDDQIVRACNYCQLTQFDPLQFIYSENRGHVNCVHFILSGECVILQCLKMRVLKGNDNGNGNTYELITVDNADLFELPSKSAKSFKSMISSFQVSGSNQMLSNSVFNIEDLLASTESDDEETLQEKKAKRKMGLKEIEAACEGDTMDAEDDDFKDEDEYEYFAEDYFVEEEVETEAEEEIAVSKRTTRSTVSARATLKSSLLRPSDAPRQSQGQTVRIETEDSVRELSTDSSYEPSTSRDSSRYSVQEALPVTETHFIDVGSLTYGGIFGLGEKIIHRVIMARTVVQCLLLPRFWLMEEEQNPGHIWQRRRFYLEGSIPSREELFGNFIKTRRWEKFKKDYVQSTLNPNSVNSTQPEDIPIICRIVETRDDI
ncbi:hypothetical protein ACLKA7_011916 [Drosophila subpalustris]